jgi:hypothetical protein
MSISKRERLRTFEEDKEKELARLKLDASVEACMESVIGRADGGLCNVTHRNGPMQYYASYGKMSRDDAIAFINKHKQLAIECRKSGCTSMLPEALQKESNGEVQWDDAMVELSIVYIHQSHCQCELSCWMQIEVDDKPVFVKLQCDTDAHHSWQPSISNTRHQGEIVSTKVVPADLNHDHRYVFWSSPGSAHVRHFFVNLDDGIRLKKWDEASKTYI